MAIHINDLSADIADLLANLGAGINSGVTKGGCIITILGAETKLQLEGEVYFDGDDILDTIQTGVATDEVTTQNSPIEISQTARRVYNEEVQNTGNLSGSAGIDFSVQTLKEVPVEV